MSTSYNDTDMSALGWFFRKKSPASNTPRSHSSQELRQLCNAVERISWEESTDEDTAGYLDQWVSKIRKQGQYESKDVYGLIDKLKELSNQNTDQVNKSTKAAIVALIVLAKQSTNLEFRNKVIDLAKSSLSVEFS